MSIVRKVTSASLGFLTGTNTVVKHKKFVPHTQSIIWSWTGRRKYSSRQSQDIDVKEIIIPVPWGHIAGRHWNGSDPSRHPVLCLHGWKDNAATFDTLMPLLVSELPQYQFVAIDSPGHGFSSHFPPGMIYSQPDIWILIKRICKHFKWDRQITMLGHSLGAQMGFSYSGTHRELVDKLVAIDSLSPIVISREETIGVLPKLTSDALKFEEKLKSGVRPSYTYDQIVDKLMKTHTGGMDVPSCKILMTRGIQENPVGSGKYEFTHDIRVHYMPVTGVSQRQVEFLAKNLKCHVLYIRASNGVNYTTKYVQDNFMEWLQKDEEGRRKGNIVRFVDVVGNHHLHLIDPKSVVPHIVRFMSNENDDITVNA